MKLILKEDIYKLGSIGDIVTVKDGYGRNYLLPKKKALLANKSNQKELAHYQKILKVKRQKLKKHHLEFSKELQALSIFIEKKTGDKNKIFGTVTTAEISQKFSELGFDIDKKSIKILSAIKTTGTYQASIKLSSDTSVQIDFTVSAIDNIDKEDQKEDP